MTSLLTSGFVGGLYSGIATNAVSVMPKSGLGWTKNQPSGMAYLVVAPTVPATSGRSPEA